MLKPLKQSHLSCYLTHFHFISFSSPSAPFSKIICPFSTACMRCPHWFWVLSHTSSSLLLFYMHPILHIVQGEIGEMQSLLFSGSAFKMGSLHYLCPQCSMVVIAKLLNSGVPPGSGSFILGAILIERRIYLHCPMLVIVMCILIS